MNKEILVKAAEKGIISKEQVNVLLDFINAEQTITESRSSTGEQLKFMRSFGDIFIALGVLLLAITSNQLALTFTYQLITISVFFIISEWLVGHKRLVLPGIVLLLSILFFVNQVADQSLPEYNYLDEILTILTSLLFYLRYKMPFSLYPVAVGSIFLVIGVSGVDAIEQPYIFVVLGLITFCVAMWYDSRDTRRITSLSDNAFWLHLLAAPLIVHGVMVSLLISEHNNLQDNSLYILLLCIVFFFIALFVDRRAILVSSFAYASYSVFKLAYQQFMQIDNLSLFILMGIGLFIIVFGTYWYRIRKWVFSPIASWNICKLVPDFQIMPVKQSIIPGN